MMSIERRSQPRSTGLFLSLCAAMLLLAMLSQQSWAAAPRGYVKAALAPLESAMMAASTRFAAGLSGFGDVSRLKADNLALQDQNAALQRQVAELQAAGQDNQVLRQALNFQRTFGHKSIVAQVIGHGPDDLSQTVEIDRGTADGVLPGMVVNTGAGLVGRVSEAGPHAAIVQTLADPLSRVSAYLSKSGLEGTVSGGPSNLQMQINPRPGLSPSAGDWVLTSGVGGGYPRGLVIAQVAAVTHDDAATAQQATLTWVNDPAGLSVVVVITDFVGS